MSNQFLREDPELSRAMEERYWTSFLSAIEETGPTVITSLNGKPFKALTALASRYGEISNHPFGTLVCEWDGRPALTARALGDLAHLLRRPDIPRPVNPWPPSAPLWEPELRREVLELSLAMNEWAANFRNSDDGFPHWRVINAGLDTMQAWRTDLELMETPLWFGGAEVIRRSLSVPVAEVTLKILSWNPLEETEAEFQQRIKQTTDDIKGWARDQIPKIKQLLVNLDTKRNPEHFHWAVLRLVCGLTYPQIAEVWANLKPESRDLDEGTVRKGVQATLKTLDLRDVAAKRK